MGSSSVQRSPQTVWRLAERQHGVVARDQLIDLGFSPRAIRHRIEKGRLHPVWRSVYAVGRPELTRLGRWMAAILTCGPGAALSHESAGSLWGILSTCPATIDVSLPVASRRTRPGIRVHRRARIGAAETVRHHGIPVTAPVATLVDLATTLGRDALENAINEADKHNVIDPDSLRVTLDEYKGRPGVRALRQILDRRTFTLTDSELERHFLPIARRAGLPKPKTQRIVSGFKVDFYWPELGLVVETDGLRYHRTPAQQARDRVRDQAHTVAGLTPLRFTRAQVRYEPEYVERTLAAVVRRLQEPGRMRLSNPGSRPA